MKINLLPWREQLAKKQQQRFVVFLILSILLVITIVVIWHVFLVHKIKQQIFYNSKIDHSIRALKSSNWQQQHKILAGRIQSIGLLEQQQLQSISILRELATHTPASIYLTQINKQADAMTLVGIATTHQDISKFVANIKQSKWLSQSELQETTTKQTINFTLRCALKP